MYGTKQIDLALSSTLSTGISNLALQIFSRINDGFVRRNFSKFTSVFQASKIYWYRKVSCIFSCSRSREGVKKIAQVLTFFFF
jgi:hypothetical protein